MVVQGGRITDVATGKAVKMPAGTKAIDGKGKFLIPGLWDMHIHPWSSTDLYFFLLLANGVTGYRDAHNSVVPLEQQA